MYVCRYLFLAKYEEEDPSTTAFASTNGVMGVMSMKSISYPI